MTEHSRVRTAAGDIPIYRDGLDWFFKTPVGGGPTYGPFDKADDAHAAAVRLCGHHPADGGPPRDANAPRRGDRVAYCGDEGGAV